jgi:AraC-like DNA-binding protein
VTPSSIKEFCAAPEGRYVASAQWFYFATRTVVGCVAWGTPGPEDARAVMELSATWFQPGTPPRASFFDMRSVDVTRAAAVFPVFRGYVNDYRERLTRIVTRFAIVHPAGFVGTLAAGFFGMVTPPYPVKLFTEVEESLTWIGERSPRILAEELASIRDGLCGRSPPLIRLHGMLSGRFRDLTIAEAARELGLSERTLQRRLRGEGTTFEREVNRVRVKAAQALMRDTNASLTAIAFEVGCASPAHLSVLFRKLVGESPSEWRAAHREYDATRAKRPPPGRGAREPNDPET